jgi:hypothetical protein
MPLRNIFRLWAKYARCAIVHFLKMDKWNEELDMYESVLLTVAFCKALDSVLVNARLEYVY